ncbi:MAG: VanZ family protein [Methylotenera sp.]|nr:VanZ family protein [Methylotenera sp.]
MAHINHRHLKLVAGCCFFLMLAGLFIGGHQSGSGSLFPPPWDKLVHFIFYGALTVFASIAFTKIPLPLLGLLIVGIGGADEIHQFFVPGRYPALDDLLADAAGCVLALIFSTWLCSKLNLR